MNDDDSAATRAELVDDIVLQLTLLKQLLLELEQMTRRHEEKKGMRTKTQLQ